MLAGDDNARSEASTSPEPRRLDFWSGTEDALLVQVNAAGRCQHPSVDLLEEHAGPVAAAMSSPAWLASVPQRERLRQRLRGA